MAKIRWRQSDIDRITNTVRQFNAAITRELKRNPNFAAVAPERLTTKGLKEQIQTRQDFNRLINKYQRFYHDKTSRQIVTNAHGVQTTKWQRKETAIDLRVVNAKRAKARKKASAEKGTLNAERSMNKRKRIIDFDSIHTQDSWNKIVKSVENESLSRYDRDEKILYYGNYIGAILARLNNPDIAKKVMKKKADSMIDAYYDNPDLQIDYIYSEEDEKQRENIISNELDSVQDEINDDENIELLKEYVQYHGDTDTSDLIEQFLLDEYGITI